IRTTAAEPAADKPAWPSGFTRQSTSSAVPGHARVIALVPLMQAAKMKKAVNSTVAACVMSVVRRNPETGNLAVGREDELRAQRRRAERRAIDPDTGAVLHRLLDEVERGELAVLAHHL